MSSRNFDSDFFEKMVEASAQLDNNEDQLQVTQLMVSCHVPQVLRFVVLLVCHLN
jgi:hypothetical protein